MTEESAMTDTDVVEEAAPAAPEWGRFTCPDCRIELNYPPGTTHVDHHCYGEPIPEGGHVLVRHVYNQDRTVHHSVATVLDLDEDGDPTGVRTTHHTSPARHRVDGGEE